MQTLLTLISLLVTLMTGGFTTQTDPDLAREQQSTAAGSPVETTSEDSSEGFPFGNTSSSQEDDGGDLGPGLDPWG